MQWYRWGIVGLGLILTLGVGCSMVTSLVLLPALLRLGQRRTVVRSATPVRQPEPLRMSA